MAIGSSLAEQTPPSSPIRQVSRKSTLPTSASQSTAASPCSSATVSPILSPVPPPGPSVAPASPSRKPLLPPASSPVWEPPADGSARVLDVYEKSWMAMNEVCHNHTVTCSFETEPPISKAELMPIAMKLQNRHSALRMSVRRMGQEALFDSRAGGQVVVRVHRCSLEEAAERELHEPLRREAVGWRLALCGSHCFLTFNTVFFDYVSMMVIVQELIVLLDGGQLEPRPWTPSLPRTQIDCAPELPTSHPAQGPPLPMQAEWPALAKNVPPNQRRSWQVWRRLTKEQEARLEARARLEGSTLQGALTAALSRALGAAIGGGSHALSVNTWVDVRERCGLPPGEIGNYLGNVTGMIVTGKPFWDLARKYNADLKEILAAPEQYVFHMLLRGDNPQSYELWLQYVREWANREPGDHVGVSIQISQHGGQMLPDRIKAAHFCRNQGGDLSGFFATLNVCSVKGALCLTFCYSDPSVSRQLGTSIADTLVADVLAASQTDGALCSELVLACSSPVWVVIGGSALVKEGCDLKSPELGRLETGAKVREVKRRGDRLNFEKLEGVGPESGWVSAALRGRPLLLQQLL
eukprot:gnl/TRDRNA2_/TRDRNA2_126541_c0_seq1.p1 gnl/TRDRNA2_/TRDRNA2_126541_c0~~gnl/TRDRNA2_/TRDRNA2_126541_c0_seq1.p1  ORF type:complete len:581 (+),score=87.71 gnl/TRDRNA2_/TRDRNA2_126541_c0_seq1:88-1830(+)